MAKEQVDSQSRSSSEFLNRPAVPHDIVHLFQRRPFPVDLENALTRKERRPVKKAIKYLDKLEKSTDRSAADDIDIVRMQTFLDNYAAMVIEARKNFLPKLFGCGNLGAPNVLFATEAIGINDVLLLMRAQAKAIAEAKQACKGGMFCAQIGRRMDQETKRQVLGSLYDLRRVGFYVRNEEQNMVYVGAPNEYPEYNLEQLKRRGNPKIGWLAIENEEAPNQTIFMEPHLAGVQGVLEKFRWRMPKVPVIGSDGKLIESIEDMKREISLEMTTTCDLSAIERVLEEQGILETHHVGLDRLEDDSRHLGIGTFAIGAGLLGLATVASVIVYRKVSGNRQKPKQA